MDKGKISVIIPCFNLEKYIENTVQSVLNQTYDNLEIILVDDGSTDSTPQLIDSLAKREGRVSAFHKQNGGVSSARLYGIERATGDWIAFVDGDDLLRTEMYTVLMDNAVRYNADISHCGYEMVFPDHTDKYYGTGKLVLQNTFEGLRDLLSGEFIEPSLANKLYKKEVILNAYEACAAAHNIRNMEDLLWNYYFFKRAKTSVFIDECYYLYVLGKGSAATSGVNKHKLLDQLQALRVTVNNEGLFAGGNTGYCLLLINFRERVVTPRQYSLEQEGAASAMFTQTEQSLNADEAVILVSIEKMQELREAYPSYFLDTKEFIMALKEFNASCAVYRNH